MKEADNTSYRLFAATFLFISMVVIPLGAWYLWMQDNAEQTEQRFSGIGILFMLPYWFIGITALLAQLGAFIAVLAKKRMRWATVIDLLLTGVSFLVLMLIIAAEGNYAMYICLLVINLLHLILCFRYEAFYKNNFR